MELNTHNISRLATQLYKIFTFPKANIVAKYHRFDQDILGNMLFLILTYLFTYAWYLSGPPYFLLFNGAKLPMRVSGAV